MTSLLRPAILADTKLSLQFRVRHPSRNSTVEYWTINGRNSGRTVGDFGRWAPADKAKAQAALELARLDLLTRQHTAFNSFAELLDAPYSPTLRGAAVKLGRAYDEAQAARGSARRSFR
jgi:hypothetical protein